MTNEAFRKGIDMQTWLCWEQVYDLAHAVEERTREQWQRDEYLESKFADEELRGLEMKALGMAQAIHEIRVLRRVARDAV